jgi:hypothetical protein
MRPRRVLLCLPEGASADALALAHAVKTALTSDYQVRLQLAGESFDDDDTPVEGVYKQPLVLRIEDPPDGGEGSV